MTITVFSLFSRNNRILPITHKQIEINSMILNTLDVLLIVDILFILRRFQITANGSRMKSNKFICAVIQLKIKIAE